MEKGPLKNGEFTKDFFCVKIVDMRVRKLTKITLTKKKVRLRVGAKKRVIQLVEVLNNLCKLFLLLKTKNVCGVCAWCGGDK